MADELTETETMTGDRLRERGSVSCFVLCRGGVGWVGGGGLGFRGLGLGV